MPDPTAPRVSASQGSADDLIASIADQQIDALISESGESEDDKPTGSAVAAELAVQATQELQEMAQKLSDEARADLVADLNGAATEAMLKPIPEADLTSEPTSPVVAEPAPLAAAPAPVVAAPTPVETVPTSAAVEPTTPAVSPAIETPAVSETPPAVEASPVIESQPAPEPVAQPPAPTVPTEPLPEVGPLAVAAPTDAEVNQAEIDALISHEPPKAPEAEPAPSKPVAAAARSGSSAEAVARELAEDVRPNVNAPAIIVESLSTRVRHVVSGACMSVLNVINLPVRNLTDNAREVIGIVGIVTLVNAMSLLLYLMIFR